MNALDLIHATLALPCTHVVVTTYTDGSSSRLETRSLGAARNHATTMQRTAGRDLIDRATGRKVRVVSVQIAAL